MRNAPLTASLSLSRSSCGSLQALPVAGTSTMQPLWAVGRSALTGACVQPLSPLKFKKAQHMVEVKHPNYKQGLTPSSAEGQELPQTQTPPGQLSL